MNTNENYFLAEKCDFKELATIYKVVNSETGIYLFLINSYHVNSLKAMCIGRLHSVTKKGHYIKNTYLAAKPITIFLDNELFEKLTPLEFAKSEYPKKSFR